MEQNPFLAPVKEKKNPLISLLQTVAIVFALGLLVYMVFLDFNEVDGPSMLPNYRTNNLVAVGKFYNVFNLEYQRDDVVVFYNGDQVLVKRVVGMPGETVQMINSQIYINNVVYTPKVQVIADTFFNDKILINNGLPLTVGKDEYFLVGDNRLESVDSRDFGSVPRENIKGKVLLSL